MAIRRGRRSRCVTVNWLDGPIRICSSNGSMVWTLWDRFMPRDKKKTTDLELKRRLEERNESR